MSELTNNPAMPLAARPNINFRRPNRSFPIGLSGIRTRRPIYTYHIPSACRYGPHRAIAQYAPQPLLHRLWSQLSRTGKLLKAQYSKRLMEHRLRGNAHSGGNAPHGGELKVERFQTGSLLLLCGKLRLRVLLHFWNADGRVFSACCRPKSFIHETQPVATHDLGDVVG